MAYANGKIPKGNLRQLPTSWSNKNRVEHLEQRAYESLSRVMARAVAESGANFQIWDAYRSFSEQVSMLKRNYYAVSGGRRSGDRSLNGVTYRRRSGRPATASPGYSNHGTGYAIDVHPGPIQQYLQRNGRTYGWTWDEGRRLGESWHFVYEPGLDQMTHEGELDHGWVQKVVGATVDHKIGTGTVAKIKVWQKANGLTADGKVGANTKAKMRGEKVSAPSPDSGGSAGVKVSADDSISVETGKTSPNRNTDRRGHSIKHITIHWWGAPSGQSHDGIVNWLCDPDAEVSAHYVVSPGRVSRIVDEAHRSWANGNSTANSESITIENDPNDVPGTLPTLAALIADIRSRHGDLPIHPHSDWTGTQCPGDYRPLLDELDDMARGETVTIHPGVASGRPKLNPDGTVDVDGRWGRETTAELQSRLGVAVDGMAGPDTIKALQSYLGAPYVDGKISRQPEGALDLGNGYRRDCIEVGSGDSQMVRLWQAYVGATIDGRLGGETIERTQVQLNASPASFTADHASTVALRTKGVLDTTNRPVKAPGGLTVDGRWGTSVTAALQRFLNSRGADLTVDGRMGPEAWKALQRYLGHPVVDGLIEHQSYKPTELGNGISPNGWRFTGRGSKGSKTIRRLQKWIGVTQDGTVGEGTTTALQRKLNDHGVGM